MRVSAVLHILIFLSVTGAASRSALHTRLSTDLSRRIISPDQEVQYRAYALFAPEKLPESYANLDRSRLLKGASPEALTLVYRMPLVSAAVREELAGLMARPSGLTRTIETDNFIVHYTETEPNAISAAMKDSVGIVLEYCRSLMVDSLGYPAPPHDNTDGPKYDVYIEDLNYYGLSYPEGNGISYMKLDNDYAGFQTAGLAGLKVTVAHEFFHAIHFDYLKQHSLAEYYRMVSWMEMSAVWMEDIAYDGINDYYNYLRYSSSGGDAPWFRVPHQSVVGENGWHEYGSSIYLMFLSEKYSPDVVKALWQQIGVQPGESGEALMDGILSGYYGTDFNASLVDFSIWNWFTGSRADTVNYYSEGDSFPEVMVDSVYHYHDLLSVLPETWPQQVADPPEQYGANYIILDNFFALDTSSVIFSDSGSTFWEAGVIRQNTSGTVQTERMGMLGGIGGAYLVNDPANVRKIVLAVTRTASGGTGNYTYKIGGPVARMEIGRSDIPETLSVAHTVACSAFAYSSQGDLQGMIDVVWSVSDTSIALLNATAGEYVTLSPRQPGSITVTAISSDSAHTDTLRFVFTEVPGSAEVLQAFPNPFYLGSDHTLIRFPFSCTETEADITVSIFTYSGRLIRTLAVDAAAFPADRYDSSARLDAAGLAWDGRNEAGEMVATGMYYYNMMLGSNRVSATKKFSVIRKKK